MYPEGIKASELIKLLEQRIKQYGDRLVYSGGTDYPEGVSNVYLHKRGDGYIPTGAFVVR